MYSQYSVEATTDYIVEYLKHPSAFRGQVLRGSGPIAEFETLLSESCQFTSCVATSNATTALLGLAIQFSVRGKEVLVPTGHWEGTEAVFRLMGAHIRHYATTLTAEQIIQLHPKASLIITTKDTPPLFDQTTTSEPRPIFIEDSMRIPGITSSPGEFSPWDIQVLSFGPGKPLSLGEGGAVLFRQEEHRKSFVRITQHPERFADEYDTPPSIAPLSINGRIHPFTAILGSHIMREAKEFAPLNPIQE